MNVLVKDNVDFSIFQKKSINSYLVGSISIPFFLSFSKQ